MCGIWAIFGLTDNLHNHCANSFTKISHRGPDAWRVEYDNRVKVTDFFSCYRKMLLCLQVFISFAELIN